MEILTQLGCISFYTGLLIAVSRFMSGKWQNAFYLMLFLFGTAYGLAGLVYVWRTVLEI